jgi:hypothetical protein
MKSYEDILGGYKLVIWDGTSDIKCPTGIFTAEQIKTIWNIGTGAETFYIVKGINRTVASMYGTDLSTNYDTEDVTECGKYTIKDIVEEQYTVNLSDGEEFVECTMDDIETYLTITDLRS